MFSTVAYGDEWPRWRGVGRDGIWRESGTVQRFESARIKLKWRVPISSGYSGPTAANGRVYVTDRVVKPRQLERVHCFDWQTGTEFWSRRYPCAYAEFGYTAGPRASVLVEDGRAYSLGAAGHIHCFDADSGTVIWRCDAREEYRSRMPNWGIAAAPVIEQDLIIAQLGGKDARLVAWSAASPTSGRTACVEPRSTRTNPTAWSITFCFAGTGMTERQGFDLGR